MADATIVLNGVIFKTVDNGDGTYSLAVSGSAGGGGDSTAANQDEQTTLLETIAGAIKANDATPTGAATGIAIQVRRDDALSTLTPPDGDVVVPGLFVDSRGALYVTLATALDPSSDQVSIGTKTTGGASVTTNLDVDESEDDIKTSAGTLYGFYAVNRTTSPLYLKFYNATAANTTVGTTTPLFTIEVPANASDHVAGWFPLGPQGIAFSTALCVAATTGFANNDTGAPAANAMIVTAVYA